MPILFVSPFFHLGYDGTIILWDNIEIYSWTSTITVLVPVDHTLSTQEKINKKLGGW